MRRIGSSPIDSVEVELMNKLKYKIGKIKNEIKWYIQRARHGYADIDTWDIDVWFLEIMPKILKQYKENLHGAPTTRSISGNIEEWKKIISRMIFLLHEMDENKCTYTNPYEEEYFKYLEEKYLDKKEKTYHMTELGKLYFGEEENKRNYMNLCKEEFFNLFSKYFYNLWD